MLNDRKWRKMGGEDIPRLAPSKQEKNVFVSYINS